MPNPLSIAVAGGINVDFQAKCFAPFRKADSNPGRASMSPGGVGRNIAENLSLLGMETELLSLLGDDSLSTYLIDDCAARKIGLAGSLFVPGGSCSQYFCLLEPDGRLVGAVAAMDAFDGMDEGAFLEAAAPVLRSTAFLIIDANLPSHCIRALAAECERLGLAMAYDPVSVAKAPRVMDCLASFRFMKPNRAEAGVLSGVEIREESDLTRAALAFRHRGLMEVYISLGAGGLFYASDQGQGIARPPSTPIVNVSGSGDAAMACLAWSHIKGYTIERRAALAVAAASLAAESATTVNPLLSVSSIEARAQGVHLEPLS